MSRRILVLSVLVFLVLAFSVLSRSPSVFAEATEANARSAIVAAQGRLVVCYQAVANASSAGANVTGLLLVLDQSNGNLYRADLAYKTGDFGSALTYAEQSLNLLVQNNVTTQADALKSSASQARYLDFMINIVGSLVGAVVVICGGFVVWRILKKRDAKGGSVAK